jgi:uncharacterized protein YbjT (DUF2867 family)
VKVIVFGATGMIGQGVLRECLRDLVVTRVLVVTRSPTGQQHQKLEELRHEDFLDFTPVADKLTGYDACFFCLGISSAGLSEADYRRVTYDYTLAAAELLARRNPQMTFIYVSGAGTDASGAGRSMWARVKGQTENALVKLPFKATYLFRPGYIQPLHGIKAKTRLYRVMYMVMAPLYPLWRLLFPRLVTTTEKVGRAMINAAATGGPGRIVESRDINALAASPQS